MKLEDRIKALMEGTLDAKSEDELVEKVVVKDKDGDEMTMGGKDEDEVEKDEDELEDESAVGDEDETELSKDAQTKKNKVEVQEDLSVDAYNNKKEQPGLSKKDPAGKIKPDTHTDKTDDNGDNARLKVGLGKKEASQLKKTSASQNDANAKNDVDTQKAVSVKEHMDAMFAGEELSETFVTKATTIFEAAVADQVAQRLQEEVETLQEEFQVKLDEAVSEVQGTLVEKVDGFLNKVVEMWLEDNAVALESGIKVEMVTSFIDGMKTLFQEHYIEVPEEKLDVVEEQAAQIEKLKQVAITLDEANDELSAELASAKKEKLVEKVARDLTATQAEKFVGLVENVEFTSDAEFESKIKTIKESYFPVGKVETSIPKHDSAAPVANGITDVHMDAYTKALSGPLKF